MTFPKDDYYDDDFWWDDDYLTTDDGPPEVECDRCLEECPIDQLDEYEYENGTYYENLCPTCASFLDNARGDW